MLLFFLLYGIFYHTLRQSIYPLLTFSLLLDISPPPEGRTALLKKKQPRYAPNSPYIKYGAPFFLGLKEFGVFFRSAPRDMAKRSTSMCQAFEQHSIRAIIKLFLYFFLLRLLFKEICISLDAKVFPS